MEKYNCIQGIKRNILKCPRLFLVLISICVENMKIHSSFFQ